MNARDLSKYLEEFRFRCTGEKELQDAIRQALLIGGYEFAKEFKLNEKDRIDFLVLGRLSGPFPSERCRVGIEVKVDGSLPQVLSQISRYLESDDIDSVLLVTTRNKHLDVPIHLCGKPVAVHFTAIGSAF